MIMRLAYRFTYNGRDYWSPGTAIGETSDEDWFKNEPLPSHKWSAIYKELPEVYETIVDENGEVDGLDPEDFGFKFEYIHKAIH